LAACCVVEIWLTAGPEKKQTKFKAGGRTAGRSLFKKSDIKFCFGKAETLANSFQGWPLD